MTSSSTSRPGSPNSPPPPQEANSTPPCQKRSRPESALVGGLLLCIDAYKAVLSPFFAGSCRFEPSCSQFAREALLKHGARGIPLAAGRLLRCRPFGGFGFDPVP